MVLGQALDTAREIRILRLHAGEDGVVLHLVVAVQGAVEEAPLLLERAGALLRRGDWNLIRPERVAADPFTYRRYIERSSAELMIAKDIYVRSRSGWFSDRSVCYLASGRPVVTMASEFSRFYPVGEGLFEYTDKAGALDAIAAVNADYTRHAKAARRMAEEFFASERVVGKMMKDAGL